jgi:hypothetical protein
VFHKEKKPGNKPRWARFIAGKNIYQKWLDMPRTRGYNVCVCEVRHVKKESKEKID